MVRIASAWVPSSRLTGTTAFSRIIAPPAAGALPTSVPLPTLNMKGEPRLRSALSLWSMSSDVAQKRCVPSARASLPSSDTRRSTPASQWSGFCRDTGRQA